MPYNDDDPFALEGSTTGLRDDYDATIVSASFTKPPTYAKGDVLCLVLTLDDGVNPPFDVIYPTGDGWSSYDGGQTVQSATKKGFHRNTAVGQLVDRVLAIEDANTVIRNRGKKADGVGPRSAAIWPGLTFHWNVFSESFISTKGENAGEKVSYNRTFPTAFVGEEDSGAMEQPKEDTVTLSGGGYTVAVGESIASQARLYAKTKSFPDWQNAVMEIRGALTNAELGAALSSEEFYSALKSS